MQAAIKPSYQKAQEDVGCPATLVPPDTQLLHGHSWIYRIHTKRGTTISSNE